MFTDFTWQDYLAAPDRQRCILQAIRRYKSSPDFRTALEANAYFRGQNTTVARKTVLRAGKLTETGTDGRTRTRPTTRDVVGNRIGAAFLTRLITHQNQYLLGNGCTLASDELKRSLGTDFDRQLAYAGQRALLHGVCWLYWNCDHAQVIEACRDLWSGFVALRDELTGEPMLGIQFWQTDARKPLCIRLFERDGITLLCREGDGIRVVSPKRCYVRLCRESLLSAQLLRDENWNILPLIPLCANEEQRSELTPAIRAKIDAYDNILSDLADNLDRANDVYWVLNNFGGTAADVAQILQQINRLKAVATVGDGSGAGATAEPHTIEVPYQARQAALTLLRRGIYEDFMGLDFDALTGRELTNVAIRTASAAMDLKADRYEWQVFRCVRALLAMLGHNTDVIRFQRRRIGNESETVSDIAAMRGDIDRRTALKLNPYLQPEQIEGIMAAAQ